MDPRWSFITHRPGLVLVINSEQRLCEHMFRKKTQDKNPSRLEKKSRKMPVAGTGQGRGQLPIT